MPEFLSPSAAPALLAKLLPQLEKYPLDWTLLQNVGAGYSALGEFDKAAEYLEKAHSLTSHGTVSSHLGLLYGEMGDEDKAYELICEAYKANPEIPSIVWFYSEELLRRGEYELGWKLHEESRPFRPGINKQEVPLKEWAGEPLEGKRIVIIPEGGFGDTVMLLRWAKHLKRMGATTQLVLWKTYGLFEGQQDIDMIYREGDTLDFSDSDYWVSTFSLPYLFKCNSVKDIPWDGPYLKAKNPGHWQPVTPKVGLVWSAGEYDCSRKYRSISREQATDLVKSNLSLHWVNLQYGEEALDPLMFSPVMNDWDDTANIVADLDLLVTVDTGCMHLAGAMNIPVWTILGGGSDHRFMLDSVCGDTSPYYPSMKIFRNGRGAGFDTSLANVKQALSNLLVTA